MEEATHASVRRVLNAIPNDNLRQTLHDLLQIAFPALQRLSTLDDSIYRCYSAYSKNPEENGTLDLMITALRNDIFNPVHRLLRRQAEIGLVSAPPPDDPWDSNEFDFGEFESQDNAATPRQFSSQDRFVSFGSLSRPSNELPQMQENEIDQAFDFLTEEENSTVQERIDILMQDLGLLSHTLREQVKQEEERLRHAFHEANYSLVIRELDTSRTSLMEGLFAFVSSIFTTFLDDFDPTTLPGYRDVLEQSLLARTGVTALIESTNDLNARIQNASVSLEERGAHLTSLQHLLAQFIASAAFQSLSPADRWELVNALQQLQAPSPRMARQAAEGLSKYLESLHMMSQNEILQQRDQHIMEEIRSMLEASQSLLRISLPDAIDLIRQAQETAQALYGRNPLLDVQLKQWSRTPTEPSDASQVTAMIQQMSQLIR